MLRARSVASLALSQTRVVTHPYLSLTKPAETSTSFSQSSAHETERSLPWRSGSGTGQADRVCARGRARSIEGGGAAPASDALGPHPISRLRLPRHPRPGARTVKNLYTSSNSHVTSGAERLRSGAQAPYAPDMARAPGSPEPRHHRSMMLPRPHAAPGDMRAVHPDAGEGESRMRGSRWSWCARPSTR
jgi:hypothetical protein